MFAKIARRQCVDNVGETNPKKYQNLDEAIFSCASDEKCESVSQINCNANLYRFCPRNSSEFRSHVDSCLYRKLRKQGNDLLKSY